MHFLKADKIFPVTSSPVTGGVLAMDDSGIIKDILTNDEGIESCNIKYYEGYLVPGFVNTHCHTELSWAKGLIKKHGGLNNFIVELEKAKNAISEGKKKHLIQSGFYEMERGGIVALADISNTSDSILAKQNSSLYFHNFIEVFGSDDNISEKIFEKAKELEQNFSAQLPRSSVSITPHATYSVSPALLRAISHYNKQLISIHHQENEDENEFFLKGTGTLAERRKRFNPMAQDFEPTGKSPIQSISQFLDSQTKTLLVHNTVTKEKDIEFALKYFSDLFWCLCPNANLYIENRLPDVEMMIGKGCRLTVGTDSLASNDALSILSEIKTLLRAFPKLTFEEILRWATLNGAEFMGKSSALGSFEKGKSPGVVHISGIENTTDNLRNSASQLIIPANP